MKKDEKKKDKKEDKNQNISHTPSDWTYSVAFPTYVTVGCDFKITKKEK